MVIRNSFIAREYFLASDNEWISDYHYYVVINMGNSTWWNWEMDSIDKCGIFIILPSFRIIQIENIIANIQLLLTISLPTHFTYYQLTTMNSLCGDSWWFFPYTSCVLLSQVWASISVHRDTRCKRRGQARAELAHSWIGLPIAWVHHSSHILEMNKNEYESVNSK